MARTEYWKSQAKKFCDFCKCWIADNKPSVGFHESGKRHKENVTKRLAEIGKNSVKSYKEELQVDKEMQKMEEEAFKAYMKDLRENPDYTSKKILEETERKKKELEESVRQQRETENSDKAQPEEPPTAQTEEPPTAQTLEPPTAAESSSSKVWHEAKSDQGYTYYWNINTSESIWEPPEEGYVSIEEQEKQKKEIELKKELKKKKREEKAKLKVEETKALKERENLKKKRKMGDKIEDETMVVGPAPKPDPYGAWTLIEPTVEEPLDLQLPEQEYITIKVPELVEPEIKFKEKTFSSLEQDESGYGITVKKETDGCSTSFKKRKLNRGNMRQKLDPTD